MNIIVALMTYFLVAELFEKTLSTATVNIVLRNGAPIIMMCHMLSANESIPGAAKQFNRELMQILTYNFFKASHIIDKLFGE